MAEERITALRAMLERIDGKIIGILEGPWSLEDSALEKVAVLESARGAVLRLIGGAETEGPRAQDGAAALEIADRA
jgi:hypothetical protein